MLKFSITENQSDWYSRIAIFIVFFWFGFLKILFMSPADDIVSNLLTITMPGVPFSNFFIFLGLLEMLIGILFLVKKWTKYALPILLVHMITTFGPLIFVPEAVWQSPLVPTIEGQYIIKNLIIVALAIGIYMDTVHIKPKKRRRS